MNGVSCQHRPSPCPCERISILDDFTSEYDDESEQGVGFRVRVRVRVRVRDRS